MVVEDAKVKLQVCIEVYYTVVYSLCFEV